MPDLIIIPEHTSTPAHQQKHTLSWPPRQNGSLLGRTAGTNGWYKKLQKHNHTAESGP
jgi:hypothetical protein